MVSHRESKLDNVNPVSISRQSLYLHRCCISEPTVTDFSFFLRLMDMSMQDESSDLKKPVPALLRSSDPYDVFRLLKSVRCTVRRGGAGAETEEPETKPLQRMPSMMSSQSLSSLSSEASSSGAAGEDSGHESEQFEGASASEDPCEAMRARFESHLSGLGQCLGQMTEAASFLSSRYEQQLDSAF